jgi:hypothetical protein
MRNRDVIFRFILIIFIAFIIILALVYFLPDSYIIPLSPPLSFSPTPSTSSQNIKTGQSYMYPDPELTPGDVLPVKKEEICVSGYTKTVRNVTVATKKEVFAEYHVLYPQPEGTYEVDHFIPLELGGSNDIKNLWLEPASPKPGFHEKDIVENYLHDGVCKGNITLEDAQRQIAQDWFAVYSKTLSHN